MREGALDRERDSVCVTLCVCERAPGEMSLRAAFSGKPDILSKEAFNLSKGAYTIIDYTLIACRYSGTDNTQALVCLAMHVSPFLYTRASHCLSHSEIWRSAQRLIRAKRACSKATRLFLRSLKCVCVSHTRVSMNMCVFCLSVCVCFAAAAAAAAAACACVREERKPQ